MLRMHPARGNGQTHDRTALQRVLVVQQTQPGIRSGCKQVWPRLRGDCVITFSPDGYSLVEAVPQLIKKMAEGYDMVIASRYLADATSDDDDVVTGFGNWLFTKIVNALFKGHYTDAMVMLRSSTSRGRYRISAGLAPILFT